MKIPPEFHAALQAEIAASLPGIITRAWSAAQVGARPPAGPPPKKPSADRVAKGRARYAIFQAIRAHQEGGASRDDIRRMAPTWLADRPLSENTLKRVLMQLREAGDIETRNSKWYELRGAVARPRLQRTFDPVGRADP
jgi:hypothetical protein